MNITREILSFWLLCLVGFTFCKDYYDILGVKQSDSKSTIVAAYRKLAKKHHPGKFILKNLNFLL